jgi:SAM-dependent methyltransferase
LNKSGRIDVPLEEQAASWDAWNQGSGRGTAAMSPASVRQSEILLRRVSALERTNLEIIDIGCGNGWTCERLRPFGRLTGLDLSPTSIAQAAARLPDVTFHCGDLFEVPLAEGAFDLAITLEVLSHVADQPAFIGRLASLLKPGGQLFLTTQNRPVLERWSAVQGPMPGTIRQWVDARQLRQLLQLQFTDIRIESVYPVGDQGLLRLVNSPKLNSLLGRILPSGTIERLKERAMLGHTLIAWARKRAA